MYKVETVENMIGSCFCLQVEVEICAQVEAFRLHANGKLPEYADGHQHVHILPGNRPNILKTLTMVYVYVQ